MIYQLWCWTYFGPFRCLKFEFMFRKKCLWSWTQVTDVQKYAFSASFFTYNSLDYHFWVPSDKIRKKTFIKKSYKYFTYLRNNKLSEINRTCHINTTYYCSTYVTCAAFTTFKYELSPVTSEKPILGIFLLDCLPYATVTLLAMPYTRTQADGSYR